MDRAGPCSPRSRADCDPANPQHAQLSRRWVSRTQASYKTAGRLRSTLTCMAAERTAARVIRPRSCALHERNGPRSRCLSARSACVEQRRCGFSIEGAAFVAPASERRPVTAFARRASLPQGPLKRLCHQPLRGGPAGSLAAEVAAVSASAFSARSNLLCRVGSMWGRAVLELCSMSASARLPGCVGASSRSLSSVR